MMPSLPSPQFTCLLCHLLILSSGGPWQRRCCALPALIELLWFLPNLKEPVCVLLYIHWRILLEQCVCSFFFYIFFSCLSDVSPLVFLHPRLSLPLPTHWAHSALVFTLSSPPGTASSFTAPLWRQQVPTSWAARYSLLASIALSDDCWGGQVESPSVQQVGGYSVGVLLLQGRAALLYRVQYPKKVQIFSRKSFSPSSPQHTDVITAFSFC